MYNEKYEFYNPLKIGDVVIVDWLSFNLKYHNYYVSIVKSIKQTKINHICRLDKFNFDFELLNKTCGDLSFSAVYYESGIYNTLSTHELMRNGYQLNATIYTIDEFKQLMQNKDYIDKNLLCISDYNNLLKMHKTLIEALELQNENNINQFYTLRIDSMFADMETFVYFYKEKPSIATIRRQIGANCSFKVAEEIYKTEPIDYEYDDLHITLQPIDISCFEKKNIDNKYDIYANNAYEPDETIEFIKEFKQKYPKELEDLHSKLDTLLSIDELIFDWFTDIEFNNETIEDFTKFIKNNFKFKKEK